MRFLLPPAIALIMIIAACGSRTMDDQTLALIGDKAITKEMLQEEINLIPPYQRENFESLEGRRALLDHIIERELLLLAAFDEGLDSDSNVINRIEIANDQLKDVLKRSIIQAYYENYVVDAVTITEDEILAYYNENLDNMFHQDASIRVSHVLVSSDDALAEVESMIETGVSFDSLVSSMSEHLSTVPASGDIGWLTSGMPMPYLGQQDEISRVLFESNTGEIIGPLETELGFHWFMITETKAEGTVPLDDVRSNIENMLLPARVNSYFKDELIPALHEEYNVTIQNIEGSPVIATIGEQEITREMIEQELMTIPPYQRTNFESPEGREILLGHIVERELLFTAAQDAGLAQDSFVVAQVSLAEQEIDRTRDMAMIQIYYDRFVVDAVEVPEEDILSYYNEHIDDIYHQDAQIRVSHILSDSEESISEVIALLDQGEPFDSVAISMSTHDLTSNLGGDLGWISFNSPLPYIGSSTEITDVLFRLDTGSFSGPFETGMGFHYFMITDRRDEGSKPLEEVRESISDALKPPLVNTYLRGTVFPALMEKYGVEINEEAFLPDESVPADSLMQMAQELMGVDPEAAIQYFELFLHRFPEHLKADQAMFLIGFTFSEQLHDYEAARETFETMIREYPESELADDASWMIDNMETPIEDFLPVEEFQEVPAPQ